MGKLAKLMRLTLESSRSNEMVLADEIDLLNKYVDLCILRYGEFTWQLDVADDLDLYDTKLPPMLVQPLVENAVQHAMRQISPAVSLEQSLHRLVLKRKHCTL